MFELQRPSMMSAKHFPPRQYHLGPIFSDPSNWLQATFSRFQCCGMAACCGFEFPLLVLILGLFQISEKTVVADFLDFIYDQTGQFCACKALTRCRALECVVQTQCSFSLPLFLQFKFSCPILNIIIRCSMKQSRFVICQICSLLFEFNRNCQVSQKQAKNKVITQRFQSSFRKVFLSFHTLSHTQTEFFVFFHSKDREQSTQTFSQDDFSDFVQKQSAIVRSIVYNITIQLMKQGECFAYNFLVVGLIALLNCPDRSDYNLPLAILAFLTWNFSHKSQRHRLLWLILASVICDAIWILAISIGAWGELSNGNQLRTLTQILSVLNFCYKMGILIYATIGFQDCKNLFTLQAFKHEVIQLK